MRKVFVSIALLSLICLVAALQAQQGQSGPAKKDADYSGGPLQVDVDVDRAQQPASNAPVLRARELMGAGVQDTNGAQIGSIEDLALNPENGTVAYAALSIDAPSDPGGKLHAVPMEALRFQRMNDGTLLVQTDIAKETLQNDPGFDSDNWPKATGEPLRRQTYRSNAIRSGQRKLLGR